MGIWGWCPVSQWMGEGVEGRGDDEGLCTVWEEIESVRCGSRGWALGLAPTPGTRFTIQDTLINSI